MRPSCLPSVWSPRLRPALSVQSPTWRSPTVLIRLGGETVVATGIHRFWKTGQGWTMARDLKPGDSIRTLGGAVQVEAIEAGGTQRVFNLQVAEGNSFLVGRQGFLVLDNSLVLPVPAPFDASPEVVVTDRINP